MPPTILVTASTPQRHPGNTALGYSSATLLVERKKGKREDIALLYFEMKIVLSNHFISVTFNCIRTSVQGPYISKEGLEKRMRFENRTMSTFVSILLFRI